MQITVDTKALLSAMTYVEDRCGRSFRIEVLDNKSISVEDGKKYTVLKAKVANFNKKDAVISIKHDTLTRMLKFYSKGSTVLKFVDNKMYVSQAEWNDSKKAENFVWVEKGDGVSMPTERKVEEKLHTLTVATEDFVKALAFVKGVTYKDNDRPAIKAVHIRSTGRNQLDFVATDGHRLHMYTVDADIKTYDDSGDSFKHINLEKESADALCDIIKRTKSRSITIVVCKHNAYSVFNGCPVMEISLKLSEDGYTDFDKVIPTIGEPTPILTVDKKALIKRLEPIVKVVNPWNGAFQLTVVDGKTIIASKSDNYSCELCLPCQWSQKLEYTLALNGKFLLEAIELFDDVVRIAFNTALSPITVYGKNRKSFCLIMPMKPN